MTVPHGGVILPHIRRAAGRDECSDRQFYEFSDVHYHTHNGPLVYFNTPK
jgi:hypothetical protein